MHKCLEIMQIGRDVKCDITREQDFFLNLKNKGRMADHLKLLNLMLSPEGSNMSNLEKKCSSICCFKSSLEEL